MCVHQSLNRRTSPTHPIRSPPGLDRGSRHRTLVTPAKRGKGSQKVAEDQNEKIPTQRHVAMTWTQRLKRVFNIDAETCRVCGGAAKVIACVEDPVVIKTILAHLEKKAPLESEVQMPENRVSPQVCLLFS